jgi:hypothetical protein
MILSIMTFRLMQCFFIPSVVFFYIVVQTVSMLSAIKLNAAMMSVVVLKQLAPCRFAE